MRRIFATLFLVLLSSTTYINADPEACSPDTWPKVLTDPSGVFASLNHPGNYQDNADCRWLIIAQPDEVINVNFTAYYTERPFDVVWFFDGNSTGSSVIMGFNGNYSPAPTMITSSQRYMLIWFTSNEFTNYGGFRGIYESVDPAKIENACSIASRPQVLTASPIVLSDFTSAYYPEPYPLQCECQWLIVAPEGSVVQLDFTFFWTEANNDWVIIYDGNSQSGKLLYRLSGQYIPPPTNIRSSGQYLFIRFATDADQSLRGFRAAYKSVSAATDNE